MTTIKLRRDTAAQWTSVNPILAEGEPGFEKDTGKYKLGDGTSTWSALDYFLPEDLLSATYAPILGARVSRSLARLRNGDALKVGVVGDSKLDPATTGNAAGDAVAKALTLIDAWSSSTVTVTNVAQSGHTAARQFIDASGIPTAITAAPDLVFIELGTNDSNSDQYGSYAAGYPLTASLAAIERACAYFRDANEACEFVFLATSPYLAVSTANAKIQTYNAGLRALAATVGAEFVDLYTTFTDQPGGWDSLLLDSTHRNAAGNDVAAAEIARHFPQTGPTSTSALAPRPTKGRYNIAKVDKAKGQYGYYQVSAAGSDANAGFVTTGTWVADGTFDYTTTPGDYFEVTASKALELLANIDLGSASIGASYPVVNVSLDGVSQATNVDLHALSSKNTTNYWVPFVTGLDGAAHTLRVTLVSGKLRVNSVAVLLGGGASTFTPETKLVSLGTAATSNALPTDGTYIAALLDTVLSLPSGWTSADVVISGYVGLRVNGVTTTDRQINYRMRHASTAVLAGLQNFPAVAAGVSYYQTVPVRTTLTLTGNTQIRLDGRVLSTDKTGCYMVGFDLGATLVRTA